jgi:exopolysaccharide biosynthesis predicted pyruvyltransferase EpsI
MTSTGKINSDELILALSKKIDEVLGSLLPQGVNCALVDFPNYSNVGDSAIWLGERKWLRKNSNRVIYVCDQGTYSPEILAGQLGNGCILINGGGNLGDLWNNHQRFRERVIQDFPENRIIQLPQSIFFKQSANLERARQIFNRHSNLTLLLRDQQSFDLARKEFTATSILCPDIAISLGAINRPCQPETEIVWLSRTDKTSLGKPEPVTQSGIERVDWLKETPTAMRERYQYLTNRLGLYLEEWQSVGLTLSRTYDLLAKERLLRGCHILGRGKVVVSNRLHAHILSLLMGIPHVLLDNSYGKVKNFYDSWTKGCEIARWANSPEEVVDNALCDTQFRMVLNAAGVELSSLDKLVASLSASKHLSEGWSTGGSLAKSLAFAQRNQIEREIIALIPIKESFIFVDDNQIRSELDIGDRIALPLLERDGQYWGPPPDDDTAIRELERLRKSGANYMVLAWPAFWWLDYYSGLHDYLNTNFSCMLKNERLIVYDLTCQV